MMKRKINKLLRKQYKYLEHGYKIYTFSKRLKEERKQPCAICARNENIVTHDCLHKKLSLFDLVGDNWNDPDCDKEIAFIWKFNVWKRSFIADFLKEYRVAAARGRTRWFKQKAQLDQIDKATFVIWGRKESGTISRYARKKKCPVFRMEDGFIRSAGLGAERAHPLSLVLDSQGIYFDARGPSDLETLIETYDFKDDKKLMKRARVCMDLIRNYNFSKYNLTADKDRTITDADGRRQILVLGQVDDDASIQCGTRKPITSNRLVEIAARENPDAHIIYRPHPEVLAGLKKDQDAYNKMARIATLQTCNAPLSESLQGIDRVYTITSLAGFEALLHGAKVTTFGMPFYAGWGLTDDRSDMRAAQKRRTQERSLEEVFAAAYLLYPQYICPVTRDTVDLEQALFYLHASKTRELTSFFPSWQTHISAEGVDKTLSDYADNLDQDLFKALNNVKANHSDFTALLLALYQKVDNEKIYKIVQTVANKRNSSSNVEIFSGLINFFIASVSYDFLKDFLNFYVQILEKNQHVYDWSDLNAHWENLLLALRRMNGRTIERLPYLDREFFIEDKEQQKFFKNYFRGFSLNCEYDRLFDLVDRVETTDENFLNGLCDILSEGLVRVERDSHQRYLLLKLIADKALNCANSKKRKVLDSYVNRAYFYYAIRDFQSLENLVESFLEATEGFSKNALLKKINVSRLKKFYKISLILLNQNSIDLSKKLFEKCKESLSSKQRNTYDFRYDFSSLDSESFAAKHMQSLSSNVDPSLINYYIAAFENLNRYDDAIFYLNHSLSIHKNTTTKNHLISQRLQKTHFLKETSEILNSVRQPKVPKGVVFLATLNCLNSIAIATPMLLELKRMGYAVVCLSQNMVAHEITGIDLIDDLFGIVPPSRKDGNLHYDWQIDWQNRKVTAEGINFYHGLFESASVKYRRASIDITDPSVADYFMSCLQQCDYILRVCKKIEQDMESLNIPFVFLAGNSHVVPFFVFRDYALNRKNPNMRFASINIAYENYYSNLGNKYSSSMSVVDMTLHRTCRAPFLAIRERFDAWYEANKDDDTIKEHVKKLLHANRSLKPAGGDDHSSNTKLAAEKIKEAKKNGQKIVACLGKILCDLAVTYDGGPAHQDMVDWINHTIEVAAANPDMLLLIKPHPHELRPEIALDLTEYLRDVVPQELPDNVVFLDHKSFNVVEMADFIDLAILWNGTSSLEFTISGVPVMMCAYFGRHDYPVDLIYPESREQYEKYLKRGSFKKPSKDLQHRSAALLHYMGTTDVAIPNTYSLRQVTNDRTGPPRWNHDVVNEYFKNGDPFMKLAAFRAVEGIETGRMDIPEDSEI